MILFGILFFILGTIIGSFLNVVAIRYNTGRSNGGRSSCYSCNKALSWHELFPVFSFIFLRGRCRHCKSKISWQYPLVELTTGLIFLGLFLFLNNSYSILFPSYFILYTYYAIIFCLLIVISIYDFRHKIIPDSFSYAFSLISTIHLFFGNTSGWDFLAGPIFFLPFYLIWRISDGKWMGLGDGKLVLGIGWLLGLIDGLSAIVLAFLVGAAVALCAMAYQKIVSHPRHSLHFKSEIPFGPFLILGTILIFFFRWDIMSLHALLSVIQ